MAKQHVEEAQKLLKEAGKYSGQIDGDFGPASLAAVKSLLAPFKPSTDPIPSVSPSDLGFNAKSQKAFNQLNPLLKELLSAARKKIKFEILDATRGKAAQEKAFKEGHSKAHFGDSAHNYVPSIAADIVPVPLDWNNRKAFLDIQKVVGWFDPKTGKGSGLAKEMRIPIRWGGDWNMDGNPSDGWDLPHYELHPWREYAAKSKLYQG